MLIYHGWDPDLNLHTQPQQAGIGSDNLNRVIQRHDMRNEDRWALVYHQQPWLSDCMDSIQYGNI